MKSNQTNNLKGKIPKKWWIVGLCSVSILGGVVAYSYSTQPQQEVAKKEQVRSADTDKKSKKTWEKEIEKETKNKEKAKDKKTSPLDKILGVVTDDESNSVFGIDLNGSTKTDKSFLVGQLAEATGKQEAKELERIDNKKANENQKNTIPNSNLIFISQPNQSKDDNDDLLKPVLPDKDEQGTKEPEKPDVKPDVPIIPDPVPNPDPTPNPDPDPVPNPDPTPNPDPVPDPDPTPDPDQPDDSLDKKIAASRLELNEAKEKANKLNNQLSKVKKELEQLNNIEEDTAKKSVKASEEWETVSDLIAEYNQLSSEIKKLIGENGEILPINYDLYQETYQKLSQKVEEIKDAQKQANQTTNQMNQAVSDAEKTAESLPEKTQEYQDAQSEVRDATSNVQTAINNAQQSQEVANAVQPEISQATQASDELTNTNQQVGKDLEESSKTDYQPSINQAKQTADAINQEAEKQNEAVANAINDFDNLPKVEDSNETENTNPSDNLPTNDSQTPNTNNISQGTTDSSNDNNKEITNTISTDKGVEKPDDEVNS
ncbi:TPA: hypothetical protein ACG77T_002032 [Enterococcus faecium]